VNAEEKRRKIITAVILALAGFALAYWMFLRGGPEAEMLEAQTSLPVPEHTVQADGQTSKSVKRAKAGPEQLRKILRRAASHVGAQVVSAKPQDDGKLEANLRCRADRILALLAEFDRGFGFRKGGQLRASGPVALVESLFTEGEGGQVKVSLTLRSV